MTIHGIMLPRSIAAANVDSYNRHAKGSADLDNGNVVQLLTLSTVAGEGEVWIATQPSATAGIQNLYMVGDPEVVLTNSAYKNIDPNVQNFYNASGKVFSAFKLQVGDIVSLTAEAIAGTKSSNGFVVGTASTYSLTWAAAAVSGLSLKLIATDYLSLPLLGSIGESQRQVIYRFECVAVA